MNPFVLFLTAAYDLYNIFVCVGRSDIVIDYRPSLSLKYNISLQLNNNTICVASGLNIFIFESNKFVKTQSVQQLTSALILHVWCTHVVMTY